MIAGLNSELISCFQFMTPDLISTEKNCSLLFEMNIDFLSDTKSDSFNEKVLPKLTKD